MIENHRTGLPWQLFMSNPEVKPMLNAIGFEPDPDPSRSTPDSTRRSNGPQSRSARFAFGHGVGHRVVAAVGDGDVHPLDAGTLLYFAGSPVQ